MPKMFDVLGYFIKGVYLRFKEDEVMLYASGIAFNGLLCLIPLLLLVTSLFGIFLQSSDLAVKQIDEILTKAFPSQPYASAIKSSIRQTIDDIIRYRGSFGLVGLGVLLWTATYLFGALRTALNRIYRLTTHRLVIVAILQDILWVIVVVVLFLVTSMLPGIISVLDSIVQEIPRLQMVNFGAILEKFPLAINFVLTYLMFFIVFRFIPEKGISATVAALSSFTTTILWIAAGIAFRWYLDTFHSFGQLYGTYAFLFVMLFWVEYSSLVFLVGAIVGQLYRERYEK
jgi:membrane protein